MTPIDQVRTVADNKMFCYSVTIYNDDNIIYGNLACNFQIKLYADVDFSFFMSTIAITL